jgi:uncharacterized membrane protein
MNKGRLEAFSDGVIAIIITIMVLQLTVPKEPTFAALVPLAPVLLGYLLSFVYVAIYWNNHHHLLTVCDNASGGVMWANMHLLFWMSLIPFVTAWMGNNPSAALPTALYGVILLLSAIAYAILQARIVAVHPDREQVRHVLGNDFKGRFSPLFYLAAILLAFVSPTISHLIYAAVALLWVVPDRRLEKL